MLQRIEKFLEKYSFWIILALSVPAAWALFVPGFYGASDDLHIAWLYEMERAIKMGQIPPRFVPDLSFGFGYPLFNFVFPLPFYLGELFHFFSLSFVDSIKGVFLLSIPLSGYFMYKFLKENSSALVALAGAIIYIYTPYRATDIYIRGAIGEAFAFVFPPLIGWAITRGNIALLGLSVAGLILSHNILSYMFLPFLLILAVIQKKRIRVSIYGFILGLLISIYFWLPAIYESRLMKYDTVFNFVDHFPTLRQLITPYFGYGASVPGPYDGMSFYVGALNILLIGLAIILIKKGNRLVWWGLATIGITIFMMNYRSTFIWQNFPFITYFQFPWRFLSLMTFATAVLVVVLDRLKYGKYLAIVLVFFSVLLNFNYFKPQDFLGRQDSYYLNRYIPVPVASEEYLKTGEEYLRLPKETEVRPSQTSPNKGINASFEIDYDKETTFDYFKYYFPGWVVKIDGKRTDVWAGRPYGQVQFGVPSGKHFIEIVFKETPFRKTLDAISLLALLGTITMIVRKR